MNDALLLERETAVAVLTLNRPGAMNALNRPLREQLAEAFRTLQADADVRVVILTGAGRAFCAGVDLDDIPGEMLLEAAEGGPDAALPAAMAAFDRPIIAAVNGVAATGGFELALMCDLMLAADTALFADTHALVGIVPGWGLSQRLARRIGAARAKQMSFSGEYINAATACEWALVNEVVPAAELMPRCRQLAAAMAEGDADVLREYKRLIDLGAQTSLDAGLRAEAAAFADYAPGVRADDVRAKLPQLAARARRQLRGG